MFIFFSQMRSYWMMFVKVNEIDISVYSRVFDSCDICDKVSSFIFILSWDNFSMINFTLFFLTFKYEIRQMSFKFSYFNLHIAYTRLFKGRKIVFIFFHFKIHLIENMVVITKKVILTYFISYSKFLLLVLNK